MRGRLKMVLALAFACALTTVTGHCASVSVNDLMERYNKATDLQRSAIMGEYQYKTVSVNGVVDNVEAWDTFDERDQTKARYYRVTTGRQQLDAKNFYSIAVFYKDRAKAEKFEKGQDIKVDGSLIKIMYIPGLFSIWVYPEELTAEDKVMFMQGQDL
jgi:hypothetical protein